MHGYFFENFWQKHDGVGTVTFDHNLERMVRIGKLRQQAV